MQSVNVVIETVLRPTMSYFIVRDARTGQLVDVATDFSKLESVIDACRPIEQTADVKSISQ